MYSGAQKSSLAANIVLPVLAIFAVVLRLVVQRRGSSSFGASEAIIVAALVRLYPFSAHEVVADEASRYS